MRTSGNRNIRATAPLLAWAAVPFTIPQPKNDKEYDSLVALLDDVLDHVGDDEQAPLAAFADLIGTVIESYEDTHVPQLKPSTRRSMPRRHRKVKNA